MATTRLSDIIDVIVYQDLPQVNGPEKTAFFDSGVVTRNAMLDNVANQAGKTVELPFWNDLDGSIEVNYSSTADSEATPQKIVQGEQVARKAFVNQGWRAADLASELAMGGTAMEAIRARTSRYFARQWQRRLLAATEGVIADNVANDDGDMVEDVSDGEGDAVPFDQDVFIDAVFTMGDAKDALTTIAVHSVVLKQMVKNDDVIYIPDSEGKLTIPTFMGLRVVVDDGMPVDNSATNTAYTSYIYGEGAFGYGEGTPETPVEVEREAAAGDGGGIETLWERNTWLLHPFGFKQEGTPSGESFSQSELKEADKWSRVLDRKLIPIASIVTN